MRYRIFSVDSAKAVKTHDFGWLNAIHYLAPTHSASFGCPGNREKSRPRLRPMSCILPVGRGTF